MFIRYRTLSYYLTKEILIYFLLSTLVFSFLFLMGKTFKIARLIIKYHIGLNVILKLLCYALPYFLSYIIPISALLSTLFTFLRMRQDNEYIAIKTAGISPISFLSFLFLFACFCFFTNLFITSAISPLGYRASKELIFSLTQKKIEISIKPGIFTNPLPGLIFYVDRIENEQLKGIFLYDERNKKKEKIYQNQLIIAESGSISQEKGKIIFYFKNGYIWKDTKPIKKLASHFLAYKKYTFLIETPNKKNKRRRGPKEHYLWELWQRIKKEKDPAFIIAFHHNIALPVTSFIFVFLGAVLGLREEKKKHLGAVSLGFVWLIIYQILFLTGKTLAKIQVISPHICLWIPNFVVIGVTLYLWHKIVND